MSVIMLGKLKAGHYAGWDFRLEITETYKQYFIRVTGTSWKQAKVNITSSLDEMFDWLGITPEALGLVQEK